jgi:hypothetical protein
MSHEQWAAFRAHLPAGKVMQDSSDVEVKIAAEALEESKLGVSFAVAPTGQKPKLSHIVLEIMKPKSAKNLETRFDEEDEAMDKMDLPSNELEASISSADSKI